MKYGYTRTSTNDKQDDHLQRRALVDAGVAGSAIFYDQVSGSKEARTRGLPLAPIADRRSLPAERTF